MEKRKYDGLSRNGWCGTGQPGGEEACAPEEGDGREDVSVEAGGGGGGGER